MFTVLDKKKAKPVPIKEAQEEAQEAQGHTANEPTKAKSKAKDQKEKSFTKEKESG